MSELIERALVVFLCVLVAYSAAMIVVTVDADSKCLSYGYRDSAVTWDFEKYCIREENEYEITVPLSDLE